MTRLMMVSLREVVQVTYIKLVTSQPPPGAAFLLPKQLLKFVRKLSKKAKRKNIENFRKKVLTLDFESDRIIITLLRGEYRKARCKAAE